MSTNKLEKISSVCITPKELIASDDFIKWLEIILEQVKGFDKDYILGLFDKIKNDKVLDKKEKDRLLKFLNNEKVEKKWKELLSKLKNVSVKLNINMENSYIFLNFSNLFNSIFAEDWYKKIHEYVRNVSNITELTLNRYKWFTKYLIEVEWVTKEIHLEDKNLKVDSSDWLVEENSWVKFKINTERDIIEFLEWELSWQQLFTKQSAEREAKELWKRLPFKDNNEFQAIIDKAWVQEFMNIFPGSFSDNWSGFCGFGECVYFWSTSTIWKNINSIWFEISDNNVYSFIHSEFDMLLVRCVKD